MISKHNNTHHAMSLEKYNKKRDFTKTAEPKAGLSKDKNQFDVRDTKARRFAVAL